MVAKKVKKASPTGLTMPSDISDELKPVAEETLRIHESVLWSAQVQFEQMKLWRSLNIFIGVPAAVLAAIAGGTGPRPVEWWSFSTPCGSVL